MAAPRTCIDCGAPLRSPKAQRCKPCHLARLHRLGLDRHTASAETRAKLSAANAGRVRGPMPTAQRLKHADAMRGRTLPQAQKAKIAASAARRTDLRRGIDGRYLPHDASSAENPRPARPRQERRTLVLVLSTTAWRAVYDEAARRQCSVSGLVADVLYEAGITREA